MGGAPEPSRRRACIDHVRSQMKVSERRVCRVLAQHQSTQRRLAHAHILRRPKLFYLATPAQLNLRSVFNSVGRLLGWQNATN